MPCWVYIFARIWQELSPELQSRSPQLVFCGKLHSSLQGGGNLGHQNGLFCIHLQNWMFVLEHMTLNFKAVVCFPVSISCLLPDQRRAKNAVATEHLQFHCFPLESWLLLVKKDSFFLCNYGMADPWALSFSSRAYYLDSQKEHRRIVGKIKEHLLIFTF